MKKCIGIVLSAVLLGGGGTSALAKESNLDKVEWDVNNSKINTIQEKDYLAKKGPLESPGSEGAFISQEESAYSPLEPTHFLPQISTRAILGTDNRIKISNMNANPYKKVVVLYSIYRNGLAKYGTGFLISNDRVATAGHCIYDLKYGFPKSIRVFAGMKDKKYKDVTTSTKVYVSSGWKNGGKDEYDFGLIKLKKPLGKKYGYFSYGPSDLKKAKVTISGCPASNADIRSKKFGSQYKHSGVVGWSSYYNVRYNIDTTEGQSGSPLFLSANSKVVGIHTMTFSRSQNAGTRITPYVYKFLKY